MKLAIGIGLIAIMIICLVSIVKYEINPDKP